MPNNLPQQNTSFIGREREAAEVKALLGQTRLLTLTGAGGAGKTRLALRTAADFLTGDFLAGDFDGVWVAELAPLADPALVPQVVARALGVREEPGSPLTRTLAEALRPRRLLLVLDNCEHLVAASAALAGALLQDCPHVRLLATSREPLGLSGERTYRVPSLSLPEPRKAQTADACTQYEAVRLFVERAQAGRPSFAVTDANAPAVAQVCLRLDGVPLAIELAAARVRSLSVEEVNARLDDCFRLLTGGARDRLPRQQTLRAMIDWSYDMLNTQERALLGRLSVFAGGWTLPAAEAVCADEKDPGGIAGREVLDLLAALVDKSLVTAETREASTRYRLLETVRQYAGERLQEGGEAEAVRGRHLAWCLSLAQEAEPQLEGPEQGKWLSLLEAEHDNLRAALGWGGQSMAEELYPFSGQALRLATALRVFWYVRCHWKEGRSHLEAALARAEAERETQAGAMALLGLGTLSVALGRDEWEKACSFYERSLAISRAVANRVGEARSLNGLGVVASNRSDWETARPLFEQALVISREIGDRRAEAGGIYNLCVDAINQGDLEAARPLFGQVLAISREIGDRRGEANNLNGLAVIAVQCCEWETAQSHFEQALTINREIGHRVSEANILNGLGDVANRQGLWGAAASHLGQALTINREIGNGAGEAESLTGLGIVAHAEGRLAEARVLLSQSLVINHSLSNFKGLVATLEECAALALAEGKSQSAIRLLAATQAAREATHLALPLVRKRAQEEALSSAHAALGEGAFKEAWAEGVAMTQVEAMEYALAVVQDTTNSHPRPPCDNAQSLCQSVI